MIVPNLMVTDMARSLGFYCDVLVMTLTAGVTADRQMVMDPADPAIVFAVLDWNGAQLMLQTVASLAAELPVFDPQQAPTPAGTIYFRDLEPDAVVGRVPADRIVKGPVQQWYGMKEVYLRDPDGHIVCLGTPEGPPPA